MTRARDMAAGRLTVASINDGPVTGLISRIQNGNMRVNQRAASTTSADQVHLCDRWFPIISVAGGTLTAGASGANNPSLTGGNGLYIQTGTAKASLAAADYAGLQHRIEGNNIADLLWGTSSARPATIAFRAYASQSTTIAVSIRNAAANRSMVVPVALSAGFGAYTVPFPGCTDGTWDVSTGIGAAINFGVAMGSTYVTPTANAWVTGSFLGHTSMSNMCDTTSRYIVVSDVQMVPGYNVPQFEVVDYAVELRKCQRYYERINVNSSGILTVLHATAGSTALGVLPYTPKRVVGVSIITTGTFIALTNTGGNAGGTLAYTGESESAARVDLSGAAGLVAGNASAVYANSTGCYVEIKADL